MFLAIFCRENGLKHGVFGNLSNILIVSFKRHLCTAMLGRQCTRDMLSGKRIRALDYTIFNDSNMRAVIMNSSDLETVSSQIANCKRRLPSVVISISLSCLLLLAPGLTSPAIAQSDGENGASGTAGDPGSDGQAGEAGGDSTLSTSGAGSGTRVAIARDGGAGGSGGEGIDGADVDETAAGGNGANGGDGGTALSIWNGKATDANDDSNASTRGLGGNGGNGGFYGLGTAADLNGIGGSGGAGGNGFAISSGSFTSRVEARGGQGGNGYGIGSTGGRGGSGYGEASIFKVQVAAGVETKHELTAVFSGGNGGNGFAGANGGDGASVVLGSKPDQFQIVDTRRNALRRLSLVGQGGRGGSSDFGIAGKAGHAILDMQGFTQSVSEQRFGENQFNVTLYGGEGGNGDVNFSRKSDGADGGHAVVHAADDSTFVSRGKTIWFYNLVGGQGGSAVGDGNTGNGGKGGSAVITSPITFDNRLDDDGSPAVVIASIAARLEGGQGGDAHQRTDTTDRADGVAGDGATAAFINNIKVENNLQFGINLTAIGGNGGAGNFNGNGGQGIIRLDEAAGPRDPAIITQINPLNSIRVDAIGGNAGDFDSPNSSATGGSAWASIVQTSDSNLTVDVESTGGIGNRGASGNSFARAKATTKIAPGSPNTGPITIADATASAVDLTGQTSPAGDRNQFDGRCKV